ncbi:hypothetical protein ABIB38_000549 [Massilia sp. UYP11]|uniref:hypothetical protein n=1 Tax=Massilia sp. UYP11 TaxID=1756385 RepID=UPI003D19C1B0
MIRAAPGAPVALAHIGFVLALLPFAETPDARHADAPVDYVAVVFIPASRPPVAAAAPAPLPVTAAPRRRPDRMRARAEEMTAPPAPLAALPAMSAMPALPPATDSQQTLAPARTIDMESLRAAARQADGARAPTAPESLRESGQMRASDDGALARAVRRAKRPDCQTKYAEGRTTVNLLLLVPLAIETITDKGCKW